LNKNELQHLESA